MPSTLAWGLTGGKKAIACGEGGRVTAGRWVKEDKAAEEDEEDIVDRVRVRSWVLGISLIMVECTGTVFTDLAEEKEVRRSSGKGECGRSVEMGDPDDVWRLVGEDDRLCLEVPSCSLPGGVVDI